MKSYINSITHTIPERPWDGTSTPISALFSVAEVLVSHSTCWILREDSVYQENTAKIPIGNTGQKNYDLIQLFPTTALSPNDKETASCYFVFSHPSTCITLSKEPMNRSEQLPYYAYVTSLSRTALFQVHFRAFFSRESGSSAPSMSARVQSIRNEMTKN